MMRLRALVCVLLSWCDCGESTPAPASIPVEHPSALQRISPSHAPVPMKADTPQEHRPQEHRTLRLHPDEAWAPSIEPSVDVDTLFAMVNADWPDHPAAAALQDAWEIGDDESLEPFLDAMDAQGLLDHAPSDYDDEWDRYLALWAMYGQSDWLGDGLGELAQEVRLSYERTPDGPTTDALALGLILVYGDSDPELTVTVAQDLRRSEDPRFRLAGTAVLLQQSTTTLRDLGGPLEDPAELRLGIEWAMENSEWQAASEMAAALQVHPLRQPDDERDARNVLSLLEPEAAYEDWFERLTTEIRTCADVFPGEDLSIEVTDGTWTIDSIGPGSDCLFGWSTPAPDMSLQVHITG